MKFYLVTLLTNTQGQDGSRIAVYDSLKNVQVAYHQTLAALHNADDVLFAVVKVFDGNGNDIYNLSETVDHIPTGEAIDVTEG